jgi:hypothetical protein
LSKM